MTNLIFAFLHFVAHLMQTNYVYRYDWWEDGEEGSRRRMTGWRCYGCDTIHDVVEIEQVVIVEPVVESRTLH